MCCRECERVTAPSEDQIEKHGNSDHHRGIDQHGEKHEVETDVCYFMRDYDATLLSLSKALKISDAKTQKWNLAALKAIVIAEQGIESGSRIFLNKARKMQLSIMSELGRSIDYYNLGNIIGAFGHSDAAEAL